MQSFSLDMKGIIESFSEDSKNMYQTIGKLENLFLNGGVEGNYYNLREEIDLEELLESNIEYMHLKICLILEYHNLSKMYEQYQDGYNKFSNKSQLKYYDEVGVLDSPVFGFMNNYIGAISFIIKESQDKVAPLHLHTTNNNTNSNVNNNTNITTIENVVEKLREIEFLDDDKSEEYNSLINELEVANNTNLEGEVANNAVKRTLEKIKQFISKTVTDIGTDMVKEEISNQIPLVLKMLSTVIGG